MGLDYLHQLCKGNRDRMAEMIRLYLQDAPDLFNRLEGSHAAGSAAELAATAHALKPYALYMGSDRLNALLGLVEKHARTGDMGLCAEDVRTCSTLNQALMVDLRKWIDQGAPPENG